MKKRLIFTSIFLIKCITASEQPLPQSPLSPTTPTTPTMQQFTKLFSNIVVLEERIDQSGNDELKKNKTRYEQMHVIPVVQANRARSSSPKMFSAHKRYSVFLGEQVKVLGQPS